MIIAIFISFIVLIAIFYSFDFMKRKRTKEDKSTIDWRKETGSYYKPQYDAEYLKNKRTGFKKLSEREQLELTNFLRDRE